MLVTVTSTANLHRAFARVEASRGMAGVDGVTIPRFRGNLEVNLAVLADELRQGRYAPLPLLRFLVAKRDGSPRGLAVPAVWDRVGQGVVTQDPEVIII
jgi:RNA-directed DNA polymerase